MEMRDFLSKQMAEKHEREQLEKQLNDEHAHKIKQDVENFTEQSRTLSMRLKRRNKDNADFLIMQMDKKQRDKGDNMNENEQRLNLQLLEQMKDNRRSSAHPFTQFIA